MQGRCTLTPTQKARVSLVQTKEPAGMLDGLLERGCAGTWGGGAEGRQSSISRGQHT